MLQTSDGYRVTKHDDGSITVHNVPIFAECFRERNPALPPPPKGEEHDGHFDAAWIRNAVDAALQRHSEGYYGPLHLGHHALTAVGDEAKSAGTFQIVGASTIMFGGRSTLAVMADLHFTNAQAVDDVMHNRWPHRSVEIKRPGSSEPEFDSLAMLDTVVPFLRLPNMRVGAIGDQSAFDNYPPGADLDPVADATFAEPWRMDSLVSDGPMVGCISQGTRTALLFSDEDHMSTTNKPKANPKFGDGISNVITTSTSLSGVSANGPLTFEDHGEDEKKKDDEDDAEKMMGDHDLDVAAIIKAIKSGDIKAKDLEAIEAAIQERGAGSPDLDAPAPAAAPIDAMQDPAVAQQFSVERAASMQMRKDIADLQNTASRKDDVDTACKRLEGRGFLNLREELVQFHDKCGAPAFAAHVEVLAKQNGIIPDGPDTPSALTGASELAMKFSDMGSQGIAMASDLEQQHAWLVENHGMRTSVEDFVQQSMQDAAQSA